MIKIQLSNILVTVVGTNDAVCWNSGKDLTDEQQYHL